MGMTVTCESCRSRFRLDEALLKGAKGARIRCRNCGGMILVRMPEPSPGPARVEPPADNAIPHIMELFRSPEEGGSGCPGFPSPAAPRRPRLPALLGGLAVLGTAIAACFLFLAEPEPCPPPPAKAEAVLPSGTPSYEIRGKDGYPGQTVDGQDYFVVRGTVENVGNGDGNAVRVRAALFGSDNAVIAEGMSFAGNRISEDLLPHMTRVRIEEYFGAWHAEEGSNGRIPPGASLPFMVVIFSSRHPVEFYTAEVVYPVGVQDPGNISSNLSENHSTKRIRN